MNPLRAVGQVMRWSPGTDPTFLGTCCAVRWVNRFVTAAHCVGSLPLNQIGVRASSGMLSSVTQIDIHGTADIAVLTPFGGQMSGAETEPFWGITPLPTLGQEFIAYGFPYDVLGPVRDEPVARLFRGHFQRFMRHQSHLGFEYDGAELSIPAPGGLSGGPVFATNDYTMLAALVTENLSSTTYLESTEIEKRPGERVELQVHRVIEYGVALVLADVADWLDTVIPPRDAASMVKYPSASVSD